MPGADEGGPEDLLIGPIDVRTDAAAVREFARALRHPDGDKTPVPLTFPIRWLALPQVRDTIAARLGGRGVPIQTGQTFSFAAPLAIDTAYALTIRIAAPENRSKDLSLDATVTDSSGRTMLTMRSELAVSPVEVAP